jgi:hypothetical protein
VTRLAVVTLVILSIAVGCSSDDHSGAGESGTTQSSSTTTTAPKGPDYFVFNGQGNNLAAYDPETGDHRIISKNHDTDPTNGRDINAQICFFPDDPHEFIAGEDTNQPNPPAGWGLFRVAGETLDELQVKQVGKLTPTYLDEGPENIGCGFLSDGRVVVSAPGDQVNGPPNGELVMFFPPIEGYDAKYCKLDVSLGTAGTIFVDDQDRIYITSARGAPGVYRYRGPFPTGPDAAHGCGKTDPTGAPMASEVHRELFIPPDDNVTTPVAVMGSPDGTFFVSSVITGVIAEYDADGKFVRVILQPPAGEQLGAKPYSTGTPFGLGFGPDGTLYYADLGVVVGDGIGPGDKTGTVRRIRFTDGKPQPPDTLDEGLDYPDGIGVYQPG